MLHRTFKLQAAARSFKTTWVSSKSCLTADASTVTTWGLFLTSKGEQPFKKDCLYNFLIRDHAAIKTVEFPSDSELPVSAMLCMCVLACQDWVAQGVLNLSSVRTRKLEFLTA